MRKLFLAVVTVLFAGCGVVSSQSIYEGLRAQQRVKDAGLPPPTDKWGPYDTYEKERENLKPQPQPQPQQ